MNWETIVFHLHITPLGKVFCEEANDYKKVKYFEVKGLKGRRLIVGDAIYTMIVGKDLYLGGLPSDCISILTLKEVFKRRIKQNRKNKTANVESIVLTLEVKPYK